jgi:hypothetical protein
MAWERGRGEGAREGAEGVDVGFALGLVLRALDLAMPHAIGLVEARLDFVLHGERETLDEEVDQSRARKGRPSGGSLYGEQGMLGHCTVTVPTDVATIWISKTVDPATPVEQVMCTSTLSGRVTSAGMVTLS